MPHIPELANTATNIPYAPHVEEGASAVATSCGVVEKSMFAPTYILGLSLQI